MSAAAPSRAAVLREVLAVTGVAALAIAMAEGLAATVPAIAPHAGTLIAAAFVLLPLGAARLWHLKDDVLGTEGAPLRRGVALGLLASLLVLVPFAIGFDVLQVQILGRQRGAGPGLASAGEEFHGRLRTAPGPHVGIYEEDRGLAIENATPQTLTLTPACPSAQPGCTQRRIAPGGRVIAEPAAAADFDLLAPDGHRAAAPILAGSEGVRIDLPVRAAARYWWLLWLLLGQVVAVAVPEEMFFRGYVLGRLRSVLPARRRILGVPFGAAHVLSALLFALIHLVAIPEPGRLLVFFPGLLFAWLAERGRTIAAPAVHHALANVTLQLLQRFYG